MMPKDFLSFKDILAMACFRAGMCTGRALNPAVKDDPKIAAEGAIEAVKLPEREARP